MNSVLCSTWKALCPALPCLFIWFRIQICKTSQMCYTNCSDSFRDELLALRSAGLAHFCWWSHCCVFPIVSISSPNFWSFHYHSSHPCSNVNFPVSSVPNSVKLFQANSQFETVSVEEVFLPVFLLFWTKYSCESISWNLAFVFSRILHFKQIQFLSIVFCRLFHTAYFSEGSPTNCLTAGSSYATNWS